MIEGNKDEFKNGRKIFIIKRRIVCLFVWYHMHMNIN